MDLFGFAKLSTVFALSHWTALFLDFEKGTVSVLTCTGTVAFDARFTGRQV